MLSHKPAGFHLARFMCKAQAPQLAGVCSYPSAPAVLRVIRPFFYITRLAGEMEGQEHSLSVGPL